MQNGIQHVLFVCTGNTCRSVMAEALFNALALEHGLPMSAQSAGLSAYHGVGPSMGAQSEMQLFGIDVSHHRATQLSSEDLSEADLVLCMERRHVQGITRQHPKHADKVFLLHDYASGQQKDVLDPFGGDARVYEACAQELLAAVKQVFAKHGYTV